LGEYIKVGKFLKPFGVEGFIRVDVSDAYFEDLLQAEHVFFKEGSAYIPLFVEGFDERGALLIKIEDIDTKEDAIIYNGKDLYLDSAHVSMEEDDLPMEKLVGFCIMEKEKKIGSIIEILEINQQILGVVDYNGKEVLVPMADDLIEHIDTHNSKIYMNLPEGLLEL
jgi:16S rRNA processing protein RimM